MPAPPRCCWWLLLVGGVGLGASACGDKAIEVTLVAPAGEAAQPASYQCVNRVEVSVFANLGPTPVCLEVPVGTITNLRSPNLAGLLDVDLPLGFAKLDIRGVRAADGTCATGDTVFHGEAFYAGGDTLEVPLLRGLDCDDLRTTGVTVHLGQLPQLLTGTTPCAPPPEAASISVEMIHVYPYKYEPDFTGANSDVPLPAVAFSAAGVATLPGPLFAGAEPPSCMMIEYASGPSGVIPMFTCYQPALGSVCGGPGDADLFSIDLPTAQAVANAIQSNVISLGVAWDPQTRRPAAGVTATVTDPDATPVRYFDFVNGSLTPSSGNVTTSSGVFAFGANAPTEVRLSIPGRPTSVTAMFGADALFPELVGVQIVPI
ncbi:MAG: hypothetical protein R3B06_05120 [Kofleriaceae bacterium]